MRGYYKEIKWFLAWGWSWVKKSYQLFWFNQSNYTKLELQFQCVLSWIYSCRLFMTPMRYDKTAMWTLNVSKIVILIFLLSRGTTCNVCSFSMETMGLWHMRVYKSCLAVWVWEKSVSWRFNMMEQNILLSLYPIPTHMKTIILLKRPQTHLLSEKGTLTKAILSFWLEPIKLTLWISHIDIWYIVIAK